MAADVDVWDGVGWRLIATPLTPPAVSPAGVKVSLAPNGVNGLLAVSIAVELAGVLVLRYALLPSA